MDKVFIVETPAQPGELFAIVSDLATFPRWIDVVHRVEPDNSAGHRTADEPPAGPWWVTLRARLGPLARSKRLRMARTMCRPPAADQPGLVRFERAETDGRNHADWTMEVEVGSGSHPESPVDTLGDSGTGSWARCRLHYGGPLWTSLLDGQLDNLAERATTRLNGLARAG